MQEWSSHRFGFGLLLVTVARTILGLGSISPTWKRSKALRLAIHQSSTSLWGGRNVMRFPSHAPGVRSECCVW
jgi:hypothetical protein